MRYAAVTSLVLGYIVTLMQGRPDSIMPLVSHAAGEKEEDLFFYISF